MDLSTAFELYEIGEINNMTALQIVQDASQDNVIDLDAVGHGQGQKPQSPITLKDMADYIDASYKTLRANWIGYIESAHEGLQSLAIRKNKQLTAFGIDAVMEYDQHIKGGGDRNSYTAMIHDRYPALEASEPAENRTVEAVSSSAIVSIEPATLTTSNELATLVDGERFKRHDAHQQGIVSIESQFDNRAQNRDRLTQFVNALYTDRVEDIKAKSALKEKLEQVAAADEVIEGLEDDLEGLINQVIPVKNG